MTNTTNSIMAENSKTVKARLDVPRCLPCYMHPPKTELLRFRMEPLL